MRQAGTTAGTGRCPGSRNREGLWKAKRDHLAERLQEIVDRAAALHADQSAAIHKELENRSDSGQED